MKCREYTLKDICPRCNSETETPIPPKFSPTDKYARLRIPKLRIYENHDSGEKDEAT
ncbi:MAG: nucleolar RNA-binding Nop10p family protein [Candidatus Bathyarchaeia archaeon]